MTRCLGKVSVAVAGLAIAVLCGQIAEAQGGGGGQGRGRGRGGFGQTVATLAANAQVQELINATDVQKTKIAEINTKLSEDRAELFQSAGEAGPAAMQGDMAKLNADAEAKVAEALDAAQRTKVLSVLIQVSGGPALNSSELQKELKVTDAQKSQLAEVATAGRGRGQRRGMGDATPEEIAAQQAERDKPYLDLLTADQKAAWAKLKDAQPVEDEVLQQIRRGRGRRGGGQGGGGGGGGGN
jgi:hypothetical protein